MNQMVCLGLAIQCKWSLFTQMPVDLDLMHIIAVFLYLCIYILTYPILVYTYALGFVHALYLVLVLLIISKFLLRS